MTSRTRAPAKLNQEPAAVRWARKKAGLNQTQLAQRAGLGRTLVVEIEAGTRNATDENLIKLAEALNCPVVVLERKREPLAESQPPAETGTPGDLPELRVRERTDQPGTDTAEVPELRNSAVGGS